MTSGNHKCLIQIFMLAVAIGCNIESTDTTNPSNKLIIPVAEEEALAIRCASWFYDNPTNPDQIQHNEIVNLIIDKGWDLQITQGGVFYQILQKGTGPSIAWGDRVSVHYTGFDLKLRPFHSTRGKNTPFEFYIGNVIEGWNEALPLVKEGGRLLLLIPSYKAYGAQGLQDLVRPNQHLIFDIELVKKLNDT